MTRQFGLGPVYLPLLISNAIVGHPSIPFTYILVGKFIREVQVIFHPLFLEILLAFLLGFYLICLERQKEAV